MQEESQSPRSEPSHLQVRSDTELTSGNLDGSQSIVSEDRKSGWMLRTGSTRRTKSPKCDRVTWATVPQQQRQGFLEQPSVTVGLWESKHGMDRAGRRETGDSGKIKNKQEAADPSVICPACFGVHVGSAQCCPSVFT